ncbi:MAG: ABC transporter permease [Bacteroidales bacterium]|nr:ABC transporter permease [Bacteroidales bacterium]MDT8431311.1 ABC transporter permease [Bacteroidales bacterium]
MNAGVLFRENLRIAFKSIRTSLLRTILTVMIIAFGIMALVGILTAIDAIQNSLTSQFSLMGANTFTIESRSMNVQIGSQSYRRKNHEYINYRQAREFKERFIFPAEVSIQTWASGNAVVKHEDYKSNPNVQVRGVDEGFLFTAGYEILRGRNFNTTDITNSELVVIVGSNVADAAFGESEDPLNQFLVIGNGRYRVTGVLKSRGTSMGMGSDRLCLIPYTNVRQYFSRPNMNYNISVRAYDPMMMEMAMSEAEGIFRIVRGLDPRDESDFNITSSDQLSQLLIENLKFVRVVAVAIGIITLLGAGIGLMNIMLVSVTERTKEIGTRKALGAKSKMIRRQFLYEAVVIGQVGGIVGIILGILIGNAVSLAIGTSFIVPWSWIILGVSVCFIIGLISGVIPARKAARLDPIIALRHE